MDDLRARMGEHNSCAKLSCGGLASVIAIVLVAMVIDSAHIIDEGTIGIYFVQGALIDETSLPGVHWAAPFITEVEEVTIRPRTDTLQPVTAVTKDGIQNKFNDIQGQINHHSLDLN
jgi:regulator of protease activity HflC (stomatin/prohibitin superfamily)